MNKKYFVIPALVLCIIVIAFAKGYSSQGSSILALFGAFFGVIAIAFVISRKGHEEQPDELTWRIRVSSLALTMQITTFVVVALTIYNIFLPISLSIENILEVIVWEIVIVSVIARFYYSKKVELLK
jgi:uncharacterized membrane protein